MTWPVTSTPWRPTLCWTVDQYWRMTRVTLLVSHYCVDLHAWLHSYDLLVYGRYTLLEFYKIIVTTCMYTV